MTFIVFMLTFFTFHSRGPRNNFVIYITLNLPAMMMMMTIDRIPLFRLQHIALYKCALIDWLKQTSSGFNQHTMSDFIGPNYFQILANV